jgi:replicative DNA helicase
MMKTPQHNVGAEAHVIGAMLLQPQIIPAVKGTLSSLDFYQEIHRDIFEAITPNICTPVAIGDRLRNKTAEVGKALSDILTSVSTSAGWSESAKIVKRLSLVRQWMSVSEYLREQCQPPDCDPDVIASETKAAIRDIEAELESGYLEMPQVISDSLTEIQERGKKNPAMEPVKTGLALFDDVFGGYEKGTYNLIIARPGIGKTAFALRIARHIATHESGTALFWSLEMAYRALARRLLSDESQIHLSKLKSGNVYEHEHETLDSAARYLSGGNMIVADHPKYREVEKLMAATESLGTQRTLSCVVVDHVQKMTSRKKYASDNSKYEYISGELAALAKALHVPVIILCQLNRQLESRPESKRRPKLEDIRSSGGFEQDADTVIGLHRTKRDSTIMQVEGLKDRDGAGSGRLMFFEFIGSTQTIRDIDQHEARRVLEYEKEVKKNMWQGGL